MSGKFFQLFFFFFEKNIPKKSDEHGWVFFSHTKKKNPEKNTQACLWNMRGSLPLLLRPPCEAFGAGPRRDIVGA